MDGSHHHLMTNILLLDTTDSDWKDVIKQTCVRILMQMAGSVCSSAKNYQFLHLHLLLTNVLRNALFTFFCYPGEHMNYILVWTGTYHHHLVPPLLIVL